MFSVLIPAFNHRAFVDRAVMSAMRSPLVSEILIVDDGSNDGTLEICSSYAATGSVRVLPNGGRNEGAHYRLNQLVEAADNEWLAVLNSDDEFAPLRFETCHAVIREEKPDLIFGAIEIIDHDSNVVGYKRGSLDPEYDFPDLSPKARSLDWLKLLNQNYVATTSNMVFTKSLWREVGGFRDYRYVHDWDFVLRAAIRHRTYYCDTVLTRYRLHSNNTIKETPAAVDGEVTRLFCHFLADHKKLIEHDEVRTALMANKHIAPDVIPAIIAVNRSTADVAHAVETERLSVRSETEMLATIAAGKAIGKIGFGFNTEHAAEIVLPRANALPKIDCAGSLGDETKPLVFILSGFFAVGGVERNTVEILRHLISEFRFVLITFEPHSEAVGSLHHQLEELGVPCIDFGHIPSMEGGFEAGLIRLKVALRPSALWVINGSTWQSANAGKIRGIFFDSVIVDQQVYDTKEGWIASFRQSAVLSSDSFVAINKAIESHFTGAIKLPRSIVSHIYPCISLDRLDLAFEKRASKGELLKRYGVPNGRKVVGFVGRLSRQKRPDRFIDLAATMAAAKAIHFLMVGRGPLDGYVKECIARHDLQNITQVEHVEDISDIGAILDGLTICSDYEGLPIALLECVYMGVPFVSTAVGDIPIFSEQFAGGTIVGDWETAVNEAFFAAWLDRLDPCKPEMEQQRRSLANEFSAANLAIKYSRRLASRQS